MKKTITIKGMMCAHCEAKVKKVLEGLEGVHSATVNHTTGEAQIDCEPSLSDEQIKTAIESKKFQVITIQG